MARELLVGIGLAAFVLSVSGAARYAESLDLLTPEAAKRIAQVAVGLMLAAFGNRMPKQIGVWTTAEAARRCQSVSRVGGWLIAVAGLVHAGLWAFAPVAVARPTAMTAVATASLAVVGYVVWTVASCRRAARNAAVWTP
jgi:hypothetical protein